MVYRQRNILNWIAFGVLVLWFLMAPFVLFFMGADAIFLLGEVLTFSWPWRRPGLFEYFISLTSWLYPLWVFIQYFIWDKIVFIPWHFKDDEE